MKTGQITHQLPITSKIYAQCAWTAWELGSVPCAPGVPGWFRGGSGVPVLIVRAVGEDIAQHPWAMSPLPDVWHGTGDMDGQILGTWKTKEKFLPCFGSFGLESRNVNPEVFKWKQTHVSFRNRQASKLQFQVLERDDNPSLCINSRPLSQSELTWLDQVDIFDTWQRVL